MQQTRKPSFLKSILGIKQRAVQKDPRKAPTPLDERQLRQVAGGTLPERFAKRHLVSQATVFSARQRFPPSGWCVGGPVYPGRSALF